MKCLICKNYNLKKLFNYKKHFYIYKCQNCSCFFLQPQPVFEDLRSIYSKKYFQAWELKSAAEMKKATFKLRLNSIKKHKPTGKILDIGCATGFFLEQAQQEGYDVYGVEISDYAAKKAKQKFGDNRIFNSNFDKADIPIDNFDIITMSDLLEHVKNPNKLFNKCYKILKPGGIIMIMTPDTDSLSARIMRKKWSQYKLEHLFYFNLKSIKFLAKKYNLKILSKQPAKKIMTYNYFQTQFNVYKADIITPIINSLAKILPEKIKSANFKILLGEMEVILKK